MKVSQPAILLNPEVNHPVCPICNVATPRAKMGSHARTHEPERKSRKRICNRRVSRLSGYDAI